MGLSIWLGLLGAFYMVSPDPAARARCARGAQAPRSVVRQPLGNLGLGMGASPLLCPTRCELWAAMACA